MKVAEVKKGRRKRERKGAMRYTKRISDYQCIREPGFGLVKISVTAFIEDDQHVIRPPQSIVTRYQSSFEAASGKMMQLSWRPSAGNQQLVVRQIHWALRLSRCQNFTHTFYSVPT